MCDYYGSVATCHVKNMRVTEKKSVSIHSRLNVRVPQDIKARIAQAASIVGQDLTEFTVSTLNERAVKVLEEHEAFVLTENERRAFLDILAAPVPEPTKRSLEAAAIYKRGVRRGPVYEFAD